MRTINRRELNQRSGQILDEVLRTGEPIEVTTRGGGSVVISPRAGSRFDQWVRQGLVTPARARLDRMPTATSPRSTDEMRRAVASDH